MTTPAGSGVTYWPCWPFNKHNCEAQGHKWITERREGFAKHKGRYHFRCVADKVVQQRSRCLRCPANEPWVTLESMCINSLSLPTEDMRTLRRERFVKS